MCQVHGAVGVQTLGWLQHQRDLHSGVQMQKWTLQITLKVHSHLMIQIMHILPEMHLSYQDC